MAVPQMKVPMNTHHSATEMEDASQGARRATEEALCVFHAIVIDVSRERDRDSAAIVTD